jgi:asparagine synthase (glutamine-hydrolysing)
MCGIAGTIGGTKAQVEAMLDRIAHRGPDGRGTAESHGAIHGHVRLAMLDTSDASAQPFIRAGSLLSFNGEIWNHKELRTELEVMGERFKTTGDTEVLAAMLCRHGEAALSRLDGMFAFVWTSASGRTIAVRDSFGKVPLYLLRTINGWRWASERKGFQFGCIPDALRPGCVFDFQTGTSSAWYQMPAPRWLSSGRVRELLMAGVAKRLRADRPICVLISGGLDSSIVLAIAKHFNPATEAYTAFYDSRSGDLKAARRVCSEFSVKLHEVEVSSNEKAVIAAAHSIEISSKAQIEIATLCMPLAHRIASDGFRACLSGEAADELFGGYGGFCIKAAKATDQAVRILRCEALSKMARGNFIRCNKVFMSAGVECRLPFMEQELVEQSCQLGKAESPPGKVLLKEAARGLVPDWIIKRSKETFQGASGVADSCAKLFPSPVKRYNQALSERFGYIPKN